MTPLPLLVVDAANVMGARPEDKWWRDRAGTARRLLSRLTGWAQEDWDVTLVVEGAARAGVPEGVADSVRVVHDDRVRGEPAAIGGSIRPLASPVP